MRTRARAARACARVHVRYQIYFCVIFVIYCPIYIYNLLNINNNNKVTHSVISALFSVITCYLETNKKQQVNADSLKFKKKEQ